MTTSFFRQSGNSSYLSSRKLQPEFEKLLDRIKDLEKSKFETRVFAYPDIISWLENKVYNKPVYEIIRERYLTGKRLAQH